VVFAALIVLTTATIALARVQHEQPLPASALPALPAPAFAIPKPRALELSPHTTRWAPLLDAVELRSAPDAAAPVLQGLAAETPEGTANLVPVLGRDRDAGGTIWVRVRAPALPDNVEGWVPRAALGGYALVDTRLVVDRERLRATLYAQGKPVFEAPVGVGAPQWPTPRGEFYVRNVLTSYRSPFYGPVAFGTSARSRVLTDWPAGGFVGIHGTSRPELIPGRVSHGCIRMRNPDIVRLARLMPVGTPLTIR
jgi:L,D-transpeptidase catalytic domain